ncbi:PadR family transcriptional regulator [Gemmatimonadota bacterium]
MQEPDALLPLKPDVFLILTILAGEDQYGYGIMQAAHEWSEGRIELQAGALYRRLKWMLDEELILEMGEHATPGAERRRYYRITSFGRQVAHAEARRMRELLAAARRVELVTDGEGA